jgi:hypothetical protein
MKQNAKLCVFAMTFVALFAAAVWCNVQTPIANTAEEESTSLNVASVKTADCNSYAYLDPGESYYCYGTIDSTYDVDWSYSSDAYAYIAFYILDSSDWYYYSGSGTPSYYYDYEGYSAYGDSGTWSCAYSDTWYFLWVNVDSYSDYCNYYAYAYVPTTSSYITITSPTSSSSWSSGYSHYIEWTSYGTSGYLDISLYTSSLSYVSSITTYTSDDGYYYWSVPYVTAGYYYIYMDDSYDSGIYDYSAQFYISGSTGYITVSTPSSGSTWTAGSSYYIYWTTYGGSGDVDIYLYTSGGSYYSTISTYVYDDGAYYWSIPSSVPAGSYIIYIEDYYYSSIYGSSYTFSIVGLVSSVPGYPVECAIFAFLIGALGVTLLAVKKRKMST